ncbi:MAG: RNA polymerase sigma factor [Deltaproteobacteria bacterium]
MELERDRELLDAFRAGKRDALERVYRAYVNDVVAIVRFGFTVDGKRIPGESNPETQLDVAQDVFVKAFSESGRKGYDGVRPYGPFIRRIARNLLIDRARKSGREVPLDADDDQDVEDTFLRPTEPDDTEAALDFKRLAEAARAFVAAQDPELADFVRLRFEEELSQADIAARMNVTRRRVRTLESRTLSGLAKWLEERQLSW